MMISTATIPGSDAASKAALAEAAPPTNDLEEAGRKLFAFRAGAHVHPMAGYWSAKDQAAVAGSDVEIYRAGALASDRPVELLRTRWYEVAPSVARNAFTERA
jgi:hypothetical protein